MEDDEDLRGEREEHYRQWCKSTRYDPDDSESKETFEEIDAEYGPGFYDKLGDDDAADWNDNAIRD